MPLFPFHCWPVIAPPASSLSFPVSLLASTLASWKEENVWKRSSWHAGRRGYPTWYASRVPPWAIYGPYTRSLPATRSTLVTSTHWDRVPLTVLFMTSTWAACGRGERYLFHLRNKPSWAGKRPQNGQEYRHRKHSRTRTTRIS